MKLTGPVKYPDPCGFASDIILALQGEEVTKSTEVADITQLCLCLIGLQNIKG